MTRTFIVKDERMHPLPLMVATFKALKALGGSGTVGEINDWVIDDEEVSEDEQSIMMPDGQMSRIRYSLAWARTHLSKGGAISNSERGVWSLTDAGLAISSMDEIEAIYHRVEEMEKERKRALAREKARAAAAASHTPPATSEDAPSDDEVEDSEDVLPDDVPPDDEIDDSEGKKEDIDKESAWRGELLRALKAMDPAAFERLSQRLLREAGFTNVEVRGQSGDGGVDGAAVLRINLISFKVLFQCKRWRNSVSSPDIQQFRGAVAGKADKGLFITTSRFTRQAEREAIKDGVIQIDLIDGERLCDLLRQYNLGVDTEVVVKPDFFSTI